MSLTESLVAIRPKHVNDYQEEKIVPSISTNTYGALHKHNPDINNFLYFLISSSADTISRSNRKKLIRRILQIVRNCSRQVRTLILKYSCVVLIHYTRLFNPIGDRLHSLCEHVDIVNVTPNFKTSLSLVT